MRRIHLTSLLLAALVLGACGSRPLSPCPASSARPGALCSDPLTINEAMAKNDAAWIDEAGETDDWIELVNTGEVPLSLGGYRIGDDGSASYPLPDVTLAPGAVMLVWADDDLDQGGGHLPFKLSSRGETLRLYRPDGRLVDRMEVPALAPDESFARFPNARGEAMRCEFASPGRPNGEQCAPPAPVDPPAAITYAPYAWPSPWPATTAPLTLSELALRPASFIEVTNTTSAPVDLARFTVTLAAQSPGQPWPTMGQGTTLPWPTTTVAARKSLALAVSRRAASPIAAQASYEGVVTLWDRASGEAIERVDFSWWPAGAALARTHTTHGQHRFCRVQTRGAQNSRCDPLPARPVGGSLRHLYTPGDFPTLAAGGTAVQMQAVKFVVDLQGGESVHFLNSVDWDLHYLWVREVIDGDPHLDRCIEEDYQVFYAGWGAFSRREYDEVDTRRYLLGTLVHHAGGDMHLVEFTTGDSISEQQMRHAFFAVMARVPNPTVWSMRPQGADQVSRMHRINGAAPIVGPNAPFRGVQLQLLSEGTAYGVLRFVTAGDLARASLGNRVLVVTDQVPNDLPFVGGLITETFQTPLAHVNVLSRNRGTPNMALRSARTDPRIAPLLGSLVRLEVRPGSFDVRRVDPAEAQAFWREQGLGGQPLHARLDPGVRGIQPLSGRGLADLPAIGAKAAQLAELGRIESTLAGCPGPIRVPANAAALPLVHSVEHYQRSGAAAYLARQSADPRFGSDPQRRAGVLREVQRLIREHPVDPAVLSGVKRYLHAHFGSARVRFRSSSNVEDLPGFNGAGLYTSVSGAVGDPNRPIADAIRAVWASLYNPRAYDERVHHRVDPSQVAMGVLIHEAFLSERANGIAISRNILDPILSDIYYMNAQFGEASVANPAPGTTTDQMIYRWGRTPRVMYFADSSLPGQGLRVLTDREIALAACSLNAIHNHFQDRLDPNYENPWFAMDIEFKLVGPERTLFIKQARPYSFGQAQIPLDCRER